MQKTLDQKLERILADPSCGDFILADAKDADMAMGMAAPGKSPEHHAQEGRFRSLDEYRSLIRRVVKQGLVDIMLMSASTNYLLTIERRLFDESHVTPAARANDTTDIHLAAGSGYAKEMSRPFESATIDQIMCGKADCTDEERKLGSDLGLYSVTFNNDLDHDLATAEAYKSFRLEAERAGFRHFLEVFDPNACGDHCPADLPRFLNDSIARILAGVSGPGRPVFLKIAYHGPAAMEQLVGYERNLVVGILGGSSGTTFDAFHQLWEAKKYGARVALYGRMINNSEHQLTFITFLRAIADGHVGPGEAVKAYHGALEKIGVMPYRPLETDLQSTKRGTAYGGSGGVVKTVVGYGVGGSGVGVGLASTKKAEDLSAAGKGGGGVDFSKMSSEERLAYHRSRLSRMFD